MRKVLKGKLRRYIICTIHKDYLKAMKNLRDGQCRRCGNCCKLLYRCPFLLRQGDRMRCLIYSIRPRVCREFPISLKDVGDVNFQCGFFFK